MTDLAFHERVAGCNKVVPRNPQHVEDHERLALLLAHVCHKLHEQKYCHLSVLEHALYFL